VIFRLVATLATEGPRALKAIRRSGAAARERAWALAGERSCQRDCGAACRSAPIPAAAQRDDLETTAPPPCPLQDRIRSDKDTGLRGLSPRRARPGLGAQAASAGWAWPRPGPGPVR
jgi:hypothetical protein